MKYPLITFLTGFTGTTFAQKEIKFEEAANQVCDSVKSTAGFMEANIMKPLKGSPEFINL